MRSFVPAPKGKDAYPVFLKQAGYYCTNNSKEDYNLSTPDDLWDESSNQAHWKNRPDDSSSPFSTQPSVTKVNFVGDPTRPSMIRPR